MIDFGNVTTAYGRLYADNSGTFIGSKSNHPLILRSNHTTALTLDTSQNATFAGTISSGAITASGNITASGGYLLGTTIYNSGNYTILNSGGTGWHSIVERGTGDNYTVKSLGRF